MAKKITKKKSSPKVLDVEPTTVTTTDISSGNFHTPTQHKTLHEAIAAYEVECEPANRMVLMFAHAHLYKENPRHILVVQKPKGSLHAGLYNLPGGKIAEGESPCEAAVRELKEETNQDAGCPQLAGAILSHNATEEKNRYIIYIYRCITTRTTPVAFHESQPASYQLISDAARHPEQWVPNLRLILPLIANDIIGFTVMDTFWGQFHTKDKTNNIAQAIVTFHQHSVADAANPKRKKASVVSR